MLTLIIGNKNYSSWSLRPWLLLRQAGIEFLETRIPLYTPESSDRIRRYSPSGKVPCLLDDDLRVWDSLAICEYIAEKHPDKQLWPAHPASRATARSVSAEMHSGFTQLRQHMGMNCKRRTPGAGRTQEVLTDIARIQGLWGSCLQKHAANGPFLFGTFSIADAMYAPVVLRFQTYAVELELANLRYADTMLALPALKQWLAAAIEETEVIPAFEPAAV